MPANAAEKAAEVVVDVDTDAVEVSPIEMAANTSAGLRSAADDNNVVAEGNAAEVNSADAVSEVDTGTGTPIETDAVEDLSPMLQSDMQSDSGDSSADTAPFSGPSLPRFSVEADPESVESGAPSQNWSLSSGFWQVAEGSPIPQNAPAQSTPAQNIQNLGTQDQDPIEAVDAKNGEGTEVRFEEPQRSQPQEAIASEPAQFSPPVQRSTPASDETLHQPNAELAQLRAENQQLYEHIAQMEALLQECQATLELQMMRSQTQESLIERQTQELEETHQALQQTQAEANRVLTELEKSGRILHHQAQELAEAKQLAVGLQGALDHTQQEVSRYQVVVETLTQELDNSQTRIAHLEETCAQLQQRSLSQDGAIAQMEADCQELQSRLNRQQRQTLHFRSALERCLGMNLTTELEAELQGAGSIQPWSLADDKDSPDGAAVRGSASLDTPKTQQAPIVQSDSAQHGAPQGNFQIEEPQEVYPSIPMAPTASTPIMLPPLGEITDAEIDEPVEVSPSDIVALLDWNLEESSEPPAVERGIAATGDDIEDEIEDAEIEDAEIDEVDEEGEGNLSNGEAIVQDSSSLESSAAVEMPFANVPPDIQQSPSAEQEIEQPEPLKQPLANLLSLGAELLNLQGLSTPQQSQESQEPAIQDNSSVSSADGADGEQEPQTPEPDNGAQEGVSFSLEDSNIDESEPRYSLSSVKLPHF